MTSKRNEIVLFLVEGKSDRLALEYPMSAFYDEIDDGYQVFFLTIPSGGDITAMLNVTEENVEEEIYEKFIRDFLEIYGFRLGDISRIVQITDMDGAYIPEENVSEYDEDEIRNRLTYNKSGIEAVNVYSILRRNEHKARVLDYLSGLDALSMQGEKIPYRIFYFSSNIDDYIHSNANLSSNSKVRKAREFNNKCMSNMNYFVKMFTRDPAACLGMSYSESWGFIKEGTRSLRRHTNLNILIESLMEMSMIDDFII